MQIVIATTELAPFAACGGLAEACAALAGEFGRLGHSVAVFLPAYPSAFAQAADAAQVDCDLAVSIGNKTVQGSLWRASLPETSAEMYLVRQDDYFARAGIYGPSEGQDYRDNCERFVYFCRAVMQSLPHAAPEADVLFAHDWPTGLLPALLAAEYRSLPGYGQLVSVFAVHNAAMQGNFWHWDMLLTGLDWKYFNWRQMEFFGQLSLLKTGLVFADALTTNSPQYAQALQSSAGCGLEGVFRERSSVLTGICPGIDIASWDPAHDTAIPAQFSAENLQGKALCKAQLQRSLALPEEPVEPLVAAVGPFAQASGDESLAAVMQRCVLSVPAQWVALPGTPAEAQAVRAIAAQYPRRAAVLETAIAARRRLLAAADIVAVSDRQPADVPLLLAARRYGAIPVARAFSDVAVEAGATEPPRQEGAQSVLFPKGGHDTLVQAVQNACNCRRQDRAAWAALMEQAMRQDVSWRRAAGSYIEVFRRTLARRVETVTG